MIMVEEINSRYGNAERGDADEDIWFIYLFIFLKIG